MAEKEDRPIEDESEQPVRQPANGVSAAKRVILRTKRGAERPRAQRDRNDEDNVEHFCHAPTHTHAALRDRERHRRGAERRQRARASLLEWGGC